MSDFLFVCLFVFSQLGPFVDARHDQVIVSRYFFSINFNNNVLQAGLQSPNGGFQEGPLNKGKKIHKNKSKELLKTNTTTRV